MTQQKKYIWLRNFALLSICGFLCYSLFPIPPLIWRLLFLVIAITVILSNITTISRLEKWVIGFWFLNIIYFFASHLWLPQPSVSLIGNISVSLLALPLFLILARKGVLTDKFYTVSVVLMTISSLVFYESMRLRALSVFINREDVTVNASVVFLFLLPFVLVLKNRFISYAVAIICAYFLMEGAKRGNIIAAIPVILCFIFFTFKNKHNKIYEKIIFLIFFIFAISWGIKQFENNEYLQKRVEQTMDGNSSNRDVIYTNIWNEYLESESVLNIIGGYGFEGTINHKQIRNYAHNDWLEVMFDYGIIGAIFYFSIFILLFKLIYKEKDLQKRFILIAVTSIWLLKSAFSMGFVEESIFMLFLPYSYAFRKDSNKICIR